MKNKSETPNLIQIGAIELNNCIQLRALKKRKILFCWNFQEVVQKSRPSLKFLIALNVFTRKKVSYQNFFFWWPTERQKTWTIKSSINLD